MYEAQFMELYKRLGVVDESNQGIPLHKNCANREECWKGVDDRWPPDSEEWSHVYRPWVGSNYDNGKLLIVGENFNECGGLDAASSLVRKAQGELREGKHRVFAKSKSPNHKPYKGTFFYFNAGYYVNALIRKYLPELALSKDPQLPPGQLIASAYDFIAYTNQVKCSPRGERSRPSKAMWEACGKHILKEEIAILKPERILILGVQDNKEFLSTHVLGSPEWIRSDTVFACNSSLNGGSVQAFAVPHPSYFRIKREKIRADLELAADKLNN